MALLPIDLNDEQGLLQISDLHRVGLQEVLGDGHLLAIVGVEALRHGCAFEVNVLNDVGFLQAIGADDGLVLEFVQDLADLIFHFWGFIDLLDTLKARLVGDKLVDVIDDDGETRSVVESARAEPRASLQI